MLNIDYRDSRPIYEQVADGFERMALCGALTPDTQLPSVRQLALELSINPNTIQKAYSELERRGVIYAVKGRGNFISANGSSLREKRLDELRHQIGKCVKEARELGIDNPTLAVWVGLAVNTEGVAK